MNAAGVVNADGQTVVDRPVMNWIFTVGYPITEAFWARVKIAGAPTDVLIQLFERRALVYVPSYRAPWNVQMANVGTHYFQWRYAPGRPRARAHRARAAATRAAGLAHGGAAHHPAAAHAGAAARPGHAAPAALAAARGADRHGSAAAARAAAVADARPPAGAHPASAAAAGADHRQPDDGHAHDPV